MVGGGGAEEEEEATAAGPPAPAGALQEAELRRVAAHVDSLVSYSYSIKPFPGKWQSLRNRLAKLSSSLAAAAAGVGFPSSDGNSTVSALLQAITSTADEAFGLARSCAEESYGGGKLLMRSNLDLVASKLDLHARTLDEAYASGVLAHARAIVLSKPGAGASREDMRAYVRDLFSRVKVGGDSEMASRALVALNEVLREDDKYARIAAVETPEAAGLLVGLLESSDWTAQEEAAAAVSAIAAHESYRPPLVHAGAVAALVRVLEETGTAPGKERAARALQSLTENSDNSWSVSAHGGVTVLLKICGDRINGGELISYACGVLRNIAGVGEIRRFMVEQGAVPVFVRLAGSKEEASAIQAIVLLQAIAGDDADMKAMIARSGGTESLVRMLDPNSSFSSKAREIAFRAIEALCFSPATSIIALLGAGFLSRVVFFLRHGETSVQESALKAASRLSASSTEARRAMGDAGLMPELVRLVGEARSPEVRDLAAEALARMVSVHRNQRRFVQDEHGVGRILQLLDPDEEKKVNRKLLLCALMAISDSNSGRRRIQASGYVKNLQKLAERDVAEAKKITKKLSSNRFLSILTGLWSS
ncbi:hypothetical protein Taro_021976 [Colocasia esculenta]|uniref:ARM repeat superfamily protein n=1 Tax=Colocasia esculenta TaxID=4460 RepID=A0A843V704_COLES|nr:hypothetical protein [Colocasia esculenta]